MTIIEFDSEYEKLADIYPLYFDNIIKKRVVYSYIVDLDKRWWAALVNRIILSSNPRLDIQDAAGGERRARKSVELTYDLLAAQDKLSDQISDRGLERALAQFGANSLLDAVFKKGSTP